MRIEFESIGGGRHAVVVEGDGRRRRTDFVVSGDPKDKVMPSWFWGHALSGVMQRDRLVALLEQEFRTQVRQRIR